jgi:probable F420-dependent oxidoreductase
VDIGIVSLTGYRGLTPPELGRAVEERGFDSLFYTEHTHIPLATRRRDGGPARDYAKTYDPFVALAAAAAATRTLLLGTGVCLVTQRDPITTAKEVASLDQISGGRFLFGVGAGWNRLELANHGTDPRTRMALLADRVQAMKAIWTNDVASYQGEFVSFPPLWSWPKPVQRPHPPVLVGGNTVGAEARVLDYGDEWFPQFELFGDDLAARIDAFRTRAAEAGRGRIPITMFGTTPDPAALDTCAAAGVDRCLFLLEDPTPSETLALLDEWAILLPG